jgi:antitoxin VapB
MAETTTVFKSGNSQAVRLPKEFRFKSKTVEIFRRGNEVVLREKPLTMGEVLDGLPPLTDEMALEIDHMMAIIHEPQPEVERDWAALWGDNVEAAASAGASSQPKDPPADPV